MLICNWSENIVLECDFICMEVMNYIRFECLSYMSLVKKVK